MMEVFYSTTFSAAPGQCVLVWTKQALVSLRLPVKTNRDGSFIDEYKDLPTFVLETIRRVQKHFAGEVQRYDDLPVQLEGLSPFTVEVLLTVRPIPPGKTFTYKQIAAKIGRPAAARAVGRALAKNPLPLIIPCHRVIYSSGGLGGFSGVAGVELKRLLLGLEGIFF